MGGVQKLVSRLLTFGMMLSFVGLIAAVLLQVFARLALPKVPSWTEEVSRFLLIWMVSCGAGLSLRENGYVNVDLFIGKFSARVQNVLRALSDLLVIFLMGIFLRYAWAHLALGRRQTSPSLEIPMQYVFYAFVVMAAGILFFAFFALIDSMRKAMKGGDSI